MSKRKITKPLEESANKDNPLLANKHNQIKLVTIAFDNNTSHFSAVHQFVTGLQKAKYGTRKEILGALDEYRNFQ